MSGRLFSTARTNKATTRSNAARSHAARARVNNYANRSMNSELPPHANMPGARRHAASQAHSRRKWREKLPMTHMAFKGAFIAALIAAGVNTATMSKHQMDTAWDRFRGVSNQIDHQKTAVGPGGVRSLEYLIFLIITVIVFQEQETHFQRKAKETMLTCAE